MEHDPVLDPISSEERSPIRFAHAERLRVFTIAGIPDTARVGMHFAVTTAKTINVDSLIQRTAALFGELIGLDSHQLETELHLGGDELAGELGPIVAPGKYAQVEVGLGHPSFWLMLEVGELLAQATVVCFTEEHGYGPLTDVWVMVSPEYRTAAAHLLAACAAIAVAELTGDIIDDGSQYLVDRPHLVNQKLGIGADASTAVAALRTSATKPTGSLEERARQRLRPLPGYRGWMGIQDPAD